MKFPEDFIFIPTTTLAIRHIVGYYSEKRSAATALLFASAVDLHLEKVAKHPSAYQPYHGVAYKHQIRTTKVWGYKIYYYHEPSIDTIYVIAVYSACLDRSGEERQDPARIAEGVAAGL